MKLFDIFCSVHDTYSKLIGINLKEIRRHAPAYFTMSPFGRRRRGARKPNFLDDLKMIKVKMKKQLNEPCGMEGEEGGGEVALNDIGF